jgi:hypothetical protein
VHSLLLLLLSSCSGLRGEGRCRAAAAAVVAITVTFVMFGLEKRGEVVLLLLSSSSPPSCLGLRREGRRSHCCCCCRHRRRRRRRRCRVWGGDMEPLLLPLPLLLLLGDAAVTFGLEQPLLMLLSSLPLPLPSSCLGLRRDGRYSRCCCCCCRRRCCCAWDLTSE